MNDSDLTRRLDEGEKRKARREKTTGGVYIQNSELLVTLWRKSTIGLGGWSLPTDACQFNQ